MISSVLFVWLINDAVSVSNYITGVAKLALTGLIQQARVLFRVTGVHLRDYNYTQYPTIPLFFLPHIQLPSLET
jgi:hypothetical protein